MFAKTKMVIGIAVAATLLGGLGAWQVLRPVGDDLDAAIHRIAAGDNAAAVLAEFLGQDSVANLAQTVVENAASAYQDLMEKHGDQIEQAAKDLAARIGESEVAQALANGTFVDLCRQYGIGI